MTHIELRHVVDRLDINIKLNTKLLLLVLSINFIQYLLPSGSIHTSSVPKCTSKIKQ